MAPRTRDDAKIGVSIQKNVPTRSPDPLSGLKVRESGFFRTFAHNIFRLLRRRCRLLMSCRYEPYASFAPTQTIFTQKRKMLWRIYGDVLGVPNFGFHGSRPRIRDCDTSLERSRRRGSKKRKIAKIRREMAEREVAAFS